MTEPILMAAQMHPNMQVAMFCLGVGVFMIVLGRLMWKNGKPELMMGYKKKPGENKKLYAKNLGRAVMFFGAGLIILSLPLNEVQPNRLFALACLILCFVNIGAAVYFYYKAEKALPPVFLALPGLITYLQVPRLLTQSTSLPPYWL
jgi:drug/metabolite transporter (DMT)-like permease